MIRSSITKVAIVTKYVSQYRLEFFNRLKMNLLSKGVDLAVIYGQPETKDMLKKDAVEIPWGIKVKNTIVEIRSHSLYWQPICKHIQGADLVIVEQANKLLVNYLLLVFRKLGRFKLAYWGHGKNFQATSKSKISEHLKRITSTKVDWWFAYTKQSAGIVHQNGFPLEKITVVQNTTDSTAIKNEMTKIKPFDLDFLRSSIGLIGHHIGLFVGGIYKEKNIHFLLDACLIIKSQIKDFELIVIGSGPDVEMVTNFAEIYPWLKYVGPKIGPEKVQYFAVSDLILLPSAVGLVVIDSFALGVPIVTIKGSNHGPEIDYLINDVNGVIVEDASSPCAYAEEVVKLFSDDTRLDNYKKECLNSSPDYSIDAMVNNFTDGVLHALLVKKD